MKVEEFIKLSKEELSGKIVCFPTDTVYGVGCMLEDAEAVEKIYALKQRDQNKPLATLVPSVDAVMPLVSGINDSVKLLMNKYWPGALTIIFDKSDKLVTPACRGINTIGLRMPNSKIALKILEHFGPMATTSVNLSGDAPLNSLKEIKDAFGDKIDYYIDDEQVLSCVSSTVVKITDEGYQILRQGDIKF